MSRGHSLFWVTIGTMAKTGHAGKWSSLYIVLSHASFLVRNQFHFKQVSYTGTLQHRDAQALPYMDSIHYVYEERRAPSIDFGSRVQSSRSFNVVSTIG